MDAYYHYTTARLFTLSQLHQSLLQVLAYVQWGFNSSLCSLKRCNNRMPRNSSQTSTTGIYPLAFSNDLSRYHEDANVKEFDPKLVIGMIKLRQSKHPDSQYTMKKNT